MATRDVLLEWLTGRLLADIGVGGIVQDRVFKGKIADIKNPVYPLVTVSRTMQGEKMRWAPLTEFQLAVVAYSSTSFDQAWNIMEAIQTSLDGISATVEGRSWVIEQATTPVEDIDPEPVPAYFTGVIFDVRQVA